MPAGKCCMLLLPPADFFKNFKKLFQEYHHSSDPDQVRYNVWPDLGPNCLQKLSADSNYKQVKAQRNSMTSLIFLVRFFQILNVY